MSLFWEHAISTTPCAQNVEHLQLNETFGTQQNQVGNWDSINFGSVSSPQEYHWSHHVDELANGNHSSTPSYSDPYGAVAMGTYQQGTQNAICPYQEHNASTENCVKTTTSYRDVLHRPGIDQHEEQKSGLPKLPIPAAVPTERIQHTLIPTFHHTQQTNSQSRPAESEVRVTPSDVASQLQSKPGDCVANFTDTSYAANSVAPSVNTSFIPNSSEVCINAISVASMSVSSPTTVVGVPKYEEACRSHDHVPAIAQVAPLRPESDSVLPAQFSTQIHDAQIRVPVNEVTGGTLNDVNVSTRFQSSPSPAEVVTNEQEVVDEIDLSVSISLPQEASVPLNEQVSVTRMTPDVAAVNDSTLSSFDVKTTSTPIDGDDSTVRAGSQIKESWEPRETMDSSRSNRKSCTASSAAGRNSRTTNLPSLRNGPERRSVQSRYRIFKEHFSGIMGRLDQYRSEPPRSEFRSSSRTGNPLMANVSNRHPIPQMPSSVRARRCGRRGPMHPIKDTRDNGFSLKLSSWQVGPNFGRRSVVTVAKNSVPRVRSVDGPLLPNLKAEEGDVSVFSHDGSSMNRSYELNPPAIYGDDFVDVARRSRRSRLSRPNSRAKSEYGEDGRHHEQLDTRGYTIPPQPAYTGSYPSGRRSAHTSMGTTNAQEYYAQQAHMYREQRRPRSSFDPRSMERFQHYNGRYAHYDVYDEGQSSVSEGADSDERGDSEEEMRKYTQKGRYGPAEGFDGQSVGEELYYFGAIHLDQFRVRAILHHFPPPMEYHRLPAIEKAAYLFYVAVYKKPYNDIGDFHRKFNREYYKYTCEGDSDNIALWKICKSMQDEYHSKRLEESQKAYEASQRKLFSDERDSIDGMSERASMDDNHDDRTSDILSVDSTQRAPLKHRVPHAFVTFGPGGKMVTVIPDSSVSVVQIDDVKAVVTDPHTVRLIDSAQSFKGPLLVGQTPAHTVRLYIEHHIKRIRSGNQAFDNTRYDEVTDCLLIWQSLGVIVQQQGRVTGPDLARLLVETGTISSGTVSSAQQNLSHRERSASPADSASTDNGPAKNNVVVDARAYEQFTELLLGGHITEAIDSALKNGLYADAIVLARRLLAHDTTKLAEIEERFIATRPQCNPVVTLFSVSSKKLVPILMNPTGDDSGNWRTHAAIILANLTSSEAMETVYDLGKALAKRDYNCAADFCFLAVAVLAGVNPFKPASSLPVECESRQNITLIHACIPEHDLESLQCCYGFSLADFHATEIFDYAIRLSNDSAYSPLRECIEYQQKRLQYAHLIADFGGFATDAFRYCVEVAREIWNYYHLLPNDVLNDLCDLADKLRYGASAGEWETAWITDLRTMIKQKQQLHHNEILYVDYAKVQQPPTSLASLPTSTDQYAPVNAEIVEYDASQHELSSTRRSRSESLAEEARDWHAQRQDPLQMSPATPHSSFVGAEAEESQGHASHIRIQSNAGQHGSGSDAVVTQTVDLYASSTIPPHLGAEVKASMDEPSLNSDDISAQSTTESTPIRTLNHQSKKLPMAQQAFQNISQVPMSVSSSHAASFHQPQVHSGRQDISSAQPNGISDSNIKKNSSTQGSKGFFGNMKEKLMKAIPSGNEMILPDDSQPTIVWDPVKGRYVGAGVEEETVSAPPPKMETSQSQPSSGGLRAARTSGGSRYFNPLNEVSSTNDATAPHPSAPVPAMQLPAKFGFIPSMPDDTGESVDPFSGQANPIIPGVETASSAQ